jgi:hypothetical protein
MNPSLPNNAGDANVSRSRQLIHIDLRTLNAKRLKGLTARGAEAIQILGSGSQDCPVCAALDGQVFKATQVPSIPPETCSCLPYCTCIMTVLTNDRQIS